MGLYYIGLMSGTSLDAIDAVLMDFSQPEHKDKLLAHVALSYSQDIRDQILALQNVDYNELHLANILANQLSTLYAQTIDKLLAQISIPKKEIRAIGCHGQTVRHAPEQGYTIQLANLALLAELTDIDVIGDFRARDIAAKGQGAPLVPAFHQYFFSSSEEDRIVLNIGGIANISVLRKKTNVTGFDTGPGNMLMDAWTQRHWQRQYDDQGLFARQGQVIPNLLTALCSDPYFSLLPPKSTGRDLFNMAWLDQFLSNDENLYDVQATLLMLTATSIANSIKDCAPEAKKLIVCGGGGNNQYLMDALQNQLPHMTILQVADFGIDGQCVEAAAFAWLAKQFDERAFSNVPKVTGAIGGRVLGALYPA